MKKKDDIKKATLGDYKNLFKIRQSCKYVELYKELKTVYLEAQCKGHQVDFNWLWAKAHNIYKNQKGVDVFVCKHVDCEFYQNKWP